MKHGRQKVSSWIDATTGVPERNATEVEEGRDMLSVDATRSGNSAQLSVVKNGKAETKVQRLPSLQTHDPVSSILLLRSWNPAVGSRARYYMTDALRVWRTDVVVEARETIDVPAGRRAATRVSGISRRLTDALEVDPKVKPRVFTYWFSDDFQRIPLRVRSETAYGKVELRLTSHAEGP